jgi:hypothetical protein
VSFFWLHIVSALTIKMSERSTLERAQQRRCRGGKA